MKFFILFVLSFLLFSCSVEKKSYFYALDQFDSSALQLNCKSGVLLSTAHDEILFAKNENEVIPPASMTKLITLWLCLDKMKSLGAGLDSSFQVPSWADYRSQPPRSSLMFIKGGEWLSLGDLFAGLSVASGNDGAYAAAFWVAGDVDSFVKLMNDRVQAVLGVYFDVIKTVFVEPSGYSNQNKTTALEFAYLSRALWQEYGDILVDFASLEAFTHGGVTQSNHNELMGRFDGILGLKTGYIGASGANVSLVAKRGDTELLAVLMGGGGKSPYERSLGRTADGASLLTWGFDHFVGVVPALPSDLTISVKTRGGKKNQGGQVASLVALDVNPLIFTRQEYESLIHEYKVKKVFPSDVEVGAIAGQWWLKLENRVVSHGEIVVDSLFNENFAESLLEK